MKRIHTQLKRFALFLFSLSAFLPHAFGAPVTSPAPSIGNIAGNIFDVAVGVRQIIQVICIITGTSLILASLYQFKKHRDNPIATKLSTPIFTFIIGAAVILLSFAPIPTD